MSYEALKYLLTVPGRLYDEEREQLKKCIEVAESVDKVTENADKLVAAVEGPAPGKKMFWESGGQTVTVERRCELFPDCWVVRDSDGAPWHVEESNLR